MRRPDTPESAQNSGIEYLLDVVDRSSLDDEHQALHPKPWMTIAPSGAVQYFDTEDQACEAQIAAGPAYSDLPEDIKTDLAKVFARLEELGFKSFSLSFQEFSSGSTCSIWLSEYEVLEEPSADPADWGKFDDIEIPTLQGAAGVMALDESVYFLGERIADYLVPESSDWKEGRVVTLGGRLIDGVAGVQVELLQPAEKEVYLPFVLENESTEVQEGIGRIVAALNAAGVESLQVRYEGGGDEGDIEDLDLFNAVGDSLGDDVEAAVAESLGVNCPLDAMWPVLRGFAGYWEDNNGSRGEITINASGSASIDHYDREDCLDSIKLVNWRVDTAGAPQVQLDASPEM